MMIVSRLLYAALCLVLAVILLISGSGASLALLAALLILPLALLAVDLCVRKHLRASFCCPVNAKKGETFCMTLRVENASRLPIAAAVCRIRVTNLLTGASETLTRAAAIAPRGHSEIGLQLSSICSGRIRAELMSLRLCDCFRLISVRTAAQAHGAVTVQPDTFPMLVSVRSEISCPDESEVYSQEKPGYDLAEPFQLRDYRDGDSLRQIHWKLSTKYERLISRDPSLPVMRSVLLFWERRTNALSKEKQDAQAEALVSLGRALLASDVQFCVGWNEAGARIVMQTVRELDDLIALLPRLLSATALQDGPYGAELYCQTAQERDFAHIVYLGESAPALLGQMTEGGLVTALVCADAEPAAPDDAAVRCFRPENAAEALMELEI